MTAKEKKNTYNTSKLVLKFHKSAIKDWWGKKVPDEYTMHEWIYEQRKQ